MTREGFSIFLALLSLSNFSCVRTLLVEYLYKNKEKGARDLKKKKENTEIDKGREEKNCCKHEIMVSDSLNSVCPRTR